MKQLKSYDKIISNIILLFVTFTVLFPLFTILNTSLKNINEFLNYPTAIVKLPEWSNYLEAWVQGEMGVYFKNSIIITGFSTSLICILAGMAAFPISRKHIKSANIVYFIFLSTTFLPTSLVPMVFIMKYLGFINTYHGYILMKVGTLIGVPIFILTGFIRSIPRDLDDAGMIDGCGYLRYLYKIVFPLMKPAMITVFVLNAILVWNDFINPYLFMTSKEKRLLTAGLYMFMGEFTNNWPILCAGLIIISLPLIITYFFLQKHIVSGMISGAIKA